ncbi:MAG: RNA methyltransferase [Flavobacteriales bacterium]|nr:RNA methyltransferase [Flavobacteriales bacterium]
MEGDRSVREAIQASADIRSIYHLADWDTQDTDIQSIEGVQVHVVSVKDLERMSSQRSPNQVIAVLRRPEPREQDFSLKGRWTLYLDRVRDPGNLGTILRIADWYGLDSICCSPDTVDEYNQKVIQASMGALFRVAVIRMEAEDLIQAAKRDDIPLAVTLMEGESIHSSRAGRSGILIVGNEGQGVRESLMESADRQVTIPGSGRAESLNVAIAAGICMDWIYRSSGE